MHVVDVDVNAVAGAEVLALRTVPDAAIVSELLLSGNLAWLERYGSTFPTDAHGAAHLFGGWKGEFVAARDAGRFGIATVETAATAATEGMTITLVRDEKVMVACADSAGRPGTGALVWIVANSRDGAAPTPGLVEVSSVGAANGTVELQHAQYWRALHARGLDVRIHAFVMWGEEMGEDCSVSFPTAGDEVLRFEVSSSGTISVRAEDGANVAGTLRWLNPPPDPDDPDDVPEFPIRVDGCAPLAVPLGARLEVVLSVPGRIDPRITFDGPTPPGQNVEVRVGASLPATRVTGRFVDEQGAVLAKRSFEAWLERDGQRVDSEAEDGLPLNLDGRFEFDLPPGSGGSLNILVDSELGEFSAVDEIRFRLGDAAIPPRAPSEPARVQIERLTAGTLAVGDVVCPAQE